MSFVLDRDGLAACPDDPARVAPPYGMSEREERALDRYIAKSKEWHRPKVKGLILSTLNGDIAVCPGLHQGRIVTMDASDLYDTIMAQRNDQDLPYRALAAAAGHAPALAATQQQAALVDEYVEKIACALANEEVNCE